MTWLRLRFRQQTNWLALLGCFCGMLSVISLSDQSALLQPVGLITFKPWELVNAVAWSQDGGLLGVAAGNKLVILEGPELKQRVQIDIGAFTAALAFSPDSSQLASGSRDGIVRVWRVADFLGSSLGLKKIEPAWSLLAHRKGVNTLAYEPNGLFLATGGNDAMARIWDAASGKPIRAMIGGTFAVSGLAFSPEGKNLAIVNGSMIRLRDIDSGRITGSFRSDQSLFCIALHPDGELIAAGDSDNQILLWNTTEAFRTGVLQYPEPALLLAQQGKSGSSRALIWKVIFSPDGRLLASGGGEGQIRIWDIRAGKLLITLTGHAGAVTSLAFHPSGRLLASGSLDGTVRLWDLQGIR